ncbi:phloem protein 2-like protein [Tanacetum coccineum]
MVESLEQRQEDEDNSKMENLKHLKIPFKEIYSATNGFVDSRMIGWGGFGGVYRAELFHVDVRKYVGMKESLVELYGYPRRKGKVALKRREITSDQGRKEFWKEIDVLSGLNHQNIISLVGFCYEYGEMIIIYDFASNGRFEKYIRNVQNLKWEQRLQICIDAAQGLNYLHSHHVIHRDVKSPNILLGDSLEGIIGDVGLSLTVKSTDSQLSNITVVGTGGYVDPKYLKRGILSKQSDIYSFGVVLLEVLCGRFATTSGTVKDRASLVDMAECHLSNNEPLQIIGDYLRKDLEDEKFLDSVKTFAAITHECLHSTETQRLTMADVLKELKKALTFHLIGVETILLKDVKSSTNHFNDERVIGSGASGKVYKGELTLFKKSIPVAVKRLHRTHTYGEGAFLKEVVKLSYYVHENIITLRGFCEEENENIIIMDYAINESLDKHLNDSSLTWSLRLNISIGAAKGLNHIHYFKEEQKTVHGDIKSSNILLDHDWKASISDFIVSKSHGTLGYLDPQYSSSGATKEADVYSFGIVLFELLSGKLAIDKVEKYSHPTLRQIIDAGDGVNDKKAVFLAWMAAHCFEEKKLDALIFDDIMKQTDVRSVDIVSEVAYKCLQKDQEKRPTMALVIQELEKAFNIHVDWEFEQKLPKDNKNIMKMIEHRESQEITKKDLYSILSSGIRLNNGKVLLSLNTDGKAKEMISATIDQFPTEITTLLGKRYAFKVSIDEFNIQKLLPVFTVLRLSNDYAIRLSPTPSKTDIEATSSTMAIIDPLDLESQNDSTTPIQKTKLSYAPDHVDKENNVKRRDGEWMMIELCRFRSHNQIVDFEVQLQSFCGHPCGSGPIFVDGIEFRPIDNVHHEESVDRLINVDSSVNWDQQSLSDFQEIMTRSQYDVPSMTKQELDKLLSTGVLIDREKLISLSKVNCKKSHMLPAKAVITKSPDAKFTKCPSSAMSRFEEVIELQRHQAFRIKCDIEIKTLSPDIAYACYLVFQIPDNCEGLKCPVKTQDLLNKNNIETTIIYLRAPGPVHLYTDKRVPDRREDGWMEVRVWEFFYNNEIKENYIPMELKLACLGGTMSGLIICGVEFRPIYFNFNFIIMDHASNESLARHLDKSVLTWGIRLKISIGAAKGVNHIHSFEEDQKVPHGDIKSSNILLNHDWEATISNFIISKSHGTLGYLDPQSYRGVTKKSDVYSFGVVLFEILSGKLAIEKAEKYSHHTLRQIINDERERYARDGAEDKKVVFLAWIAARCFEENKLEALIFDDLTEQTDRKSIDVVSKVAYQCLNKDQEKRPTMDLVIHELEKALNIHEEWECEQKLPEDYERIMKMIENPESKIITKKDLYSHLSSGTRLNNGEVWLSVSKDGKVNEMISATTFSYENCWSSELKVLENSRFGTVLKISDTSHLNIRIDIKTQFLSLGIIHGAYLVFKFCDPKTVSSEPYVKLEYSIACEDFNSYVAERRDDGWIMIELSALGIIIKLLNLRFSWSGFGDILVAVAPSW